MEREVQKKVIEIRILEEQIRHLEEQANIVEREILGLQTTHADLDEIKKMRQMEAIIPLGRNIFINANIDSADNVLVDVGSKIVVKKSVEEAKKTIERQKEKLAVAKEQISKEAERVMEQIDKIDMEITSLQKQGNA